jgi:hypothetical protein
MRDRRRAIASNVGKSMPVVVGLLLLTVAALRAQGGARYELISWTVDGGGGTSDREDYVLGGTIGQPDAGRSSGGSYVLQGGFPHAGSPHVGPYWAYLPLALREHRSWDLYYEPNDTWQAAYGPLAFGPPYRAYPDDQEDYYFFDLSSASSVTVRAEGYQAEGQLLLYRYHESGDFTLIGQDARGLSTMIIEDALEAGQYYVRVYTSGDRSNSALYTLTVTIN